MSIPYAIIKSADCPDLNGIFLIEESYYTTKEKKHASPHLFLFTEEQDGIKLTSYEIPEGYDKSAFTYRQLETVNYSDLKISEKFTPAIYQLKGSVWEGGSVSMFSPVLKFTLFERMSEEMLEVSECLEVNGKRTMGYDEPTGTKENKFIMTCGMKSCIFWFPPNMQLLKKAFKPFFKSGQISLLFQLFFDQI